MIRRHFFRTLLVTILLAVTLVAALPETVSAHAGVIRSDPPDNSNLPQAPKQIRLWFNEAPAIKFTTIRVLDMHGQSVPVTFKLDPLNPTLIVVDLPALGSGVYSVNWKALSAVDGHYGQGLVVFGVGTGVDAGTAAGDTSQPINWIGSVLRWFFFIGMAGLTGALAVILFVVLPRRREGEEEEITALRLAARRRLWHWAMGMAALAWLAGLAQMIQQVLDGLSSVSGDVNVLNVFGQLSVTQWGYTWLARQVLLVGLMALLAVNTRREDESRSTIGSGYFTLLLLVGIAVCEALSGHAAAVANPLLPVAVDTLHLLAIGVWAGGVAALAAGLLPTVMDRHDKVYETEPGQQMLRHYFGAYSRYAAISVGIVVGSGIYSTSQLVYSPDALLETFYGRTLGIKIFLMLLVGLAGLVNSMILHPRLAAVPGRLLRKPSGWSPLPLQRLPAVIRIEAVLGVLVLAMSGLLTSNAPATGTEFQAANYTQPDLVATTVNDLIITLSVKPNHPGQNLFYVSTASTRRPAPAEVLRVIVRMRYLDQDLGQQEVTADPNGLNDYQFSGTYLSLPGHWSMDVVVRRKGIQDTTANFDWYVIPAKSQPVLVSTIPLKPLLAPAGLAILGIVFAAALFFWDSPTKKNTLGSRPVQSKKQL